MDTAELKLKLPLLIGTILFLAGGVDSLSQGKSLLGVANLLMAATNLLAFEFAGKTPEMTGVWIHLANAAVASVVGYDYFLAGTRGLHWAWAVAAAAFVVAAAASYRQARRAEDAEDAENAEDAEDPEDVRDDPASPPPPES